jgi:SAM-dependent methyltransferase
MSSYTGRHAELYDLFYADKPYEEEASFVHRCLLAYGDGPMRRVLELACGTGSHALALERLGHEILATDDSEDMLARARHKAAQQSSQVVFERRNMTALDAAGGPFDAAVCMFDSIGYVLTNEALRQVFDGVRAHLRPGGLFVFEFWHAAAMLRSYESVRVRRWAQPDGELLRISETTLEHEKQLAHVTYTIYELGLDGTYKGLKETMSNRYFLVQEMAGWLKASGFAPVKWFAGFSDKEKITEQTWHIVAVARRLDD